MNQIEIRSRKAYQIDTRKLSGIIENSLSVFKQSNSLIELDFVSQTEIKKLNRIHRSINEATDILSFPQIEIPGVEVKVLGSLIISPEIVAQKNENLDDVIKHGILHLLGYDHEVDQRAWEIAAKEIDCKY